MFYLLLGVCALIASELAVNAAFPRLMASLAWLPVARRPLRLRLPAEGYRAPPTQDVARIEAALVGWSKTHGDGLGVWRDHEGYLRLGARFTPVCRLAIEPGEPPTLTAHVAPYPLSPVLFGFLGARFLPGVLMWVPPAVAIGAYVYALGRYRRQVRERVEPLLDRVESALDG